MAYKTRARTGQMGNLSPDRLFLLQYLQRFLTDVASRRQMHMPVRDLGCTGCNICDSRASAYKLIQALYIPVLMCF
jgi:hypothetical protein